MSKCVWILLLVLMTGCGVEKPGTMGTEEKNTEEVEVISDLTEEVENNSVYASPYEGFVDKEGYISPYWDIEFSLPKAWEVMTEDALRQVGDVGAYLAEGEVIEGEILIGVQASEDHEGMVTDSLLLIVYPKVRDIEEVMLGEQRALEQYEGLKVEDLTIRKGQLFYKNQGLVMDYTIEGVVAQSVGLIEKGDYFLKVIITSDVSRLGALQEYIGMSYLD